MENNYKGIYMRLILLEFLIIWGAFANATENRFALLISNEKYPESAKGINLFGPLGKAHRERTKREVWFAIDRQTREIIGIFVGDRSRESAKELWKTLHLFIVRGVAPLPMCRY